MRHHIYYAEGNPRTPPRGYTVRRRRVTLLVVLSWLVVNGGALWLVLPAAEPLRDKIVSLAAFAFLTGLIALAVWGVILSFSQKYDTPPPLQKRKE